MLGEPPQPDHPQPQPRVWMTRQEAARYASVSVRTLSRWSIATSKVGHTVRYHCDDIDAFLMKHRVEPSSPRAARARPVAETRRTTPTSTLARELLDLFKR